MSNSLKPLRSKLCLMVIYGAASGTLRRRVALCGSLRSTTNSWFPPRRPANGTLAALYKGGSSPISGIDIDRFDRRFRSDNCPGKRNIESRMVGRAEQLRSRQTSSANALPDSKLKGRFKTKQLHGRVLRNSPADQRGFG